MDSVHVGDALFHTAYVLVDGTGDSTGKMALQSTCVECQSMTYLNVTITQYAQWTVGNRPIQDIFPDVSPGNREQFFKTGMCDSCWEAMFDSFSPYGGM